MALAASLLTAGGAPLAPAGTKIQVKAPAMAKPKAPAAPKPPKAPAKPKALPTNPLAPLSPQQIRQQATKTVNSSYAGQFQDLDQQTSQAQNLYNTQVSDDAAFNQWLTTNASQMQTQTDAVNQKLADLMTSIRATQGANLSALPGQLAATEQNNGGGLVSAPGQVEQGLQGAVAPTIANANNAVAGQSVQQANSAVGANSLVENAGDVATGRIDQSKASQFTALNTTLNNVAANRTKLLTARTGDISKEIARLQGVEISKRQWLATNAEQEQELGIKTATANSTIAKNSADAAATTETAATGAANAKTNAAKAAETALNNAAKLGQSAPLVQAEINRDNAAAAASQEDAAVKAAKAAGKPVLTEAQTANVYYNITNAKNTVANIIQNGYSSAGNKTLTKLTPQQAYQLVSSGGTYYTRGPSGAPVAHSAKAIGTTPVDSTVILNAAYNLATRGKISTGDLDTLNNSGIYGVESRYGVYAPQPAQSTAGHGA